MTNRTHLYVSIVPAAALTGALAVACILLRPADARAECFQTGSSVDCTGRDGDGFNSTETLNVRIRPNAFIGNILSREVVGTCPLSLPGIAVGPSSTVLNEGLISSFGVCGFGISAGPGSAVRNVGTILTHDIIAFAIVAGGGSTVINSGRIATEYQAGVGILGGDRMNVTVDAEGSITTLGQGADGIAVGAAATVTHRGTLAVRGDASAGINAGPQSNVVNEGDIEASGNNSIGVQISDGRLTNSGSIRSIVAGSVRSLTPTTAVSLLGAGAQFLNTGVVAATHVGVRLDVRDANIRNEGEIEVFLPATSDELTLTNGGAIVAAGTGGLLVTNTGSIKTRDGLPALRSLGPRVTLINSGAITGDVLLAGGGDVVTFRQGGTLSGTIDFGGGDDLLIVEGGGTIDYGVLNLEILSTGATGTLTLARNLSVRQQVNVFPNNEMVLNEGVRLAAAATGNLGGLRGFGTIDGAVTNSGRLAPGTQNRKGVLTITGPFRQFAEGTLAMRLAPDGSSDRLLLGGPATFAGTLAVTYDGTAFRDGQRFDVISPIVGSLSSTGSFLLQAPDLAFVKAALVTGPSGGITVEMSRLPYSSAGATGAQTSVGRELDRLRSTSPIPLASTFDQLERATPETATEILAGFTPEGAGAIQNMGILTLERLAFGLRNRPASSEGQRLTWASGFTSASRSGDVSSAGHYGLDGVMAGIEFPLGLARFGIGAARVDGSFTRGTNVASYDATLLALTASWRWESFALDAAASYGHGSPRTHRLAGNGEVLSAHSNTDLWSATVLGTSHGSLGLVDLSPYLGADYRRASLGALDEGRVLAVRTDASAIESLRARAGVTVSGAVGHVRPHVDLSVSTELLQRAPKIPAVLIGVAGSGFELYGDPRKKFALEAEAGVNVAIAAGLEGFVSGAMTANDLLAGRTFTAGLTYRW